MTNREQTKTDTLDKTKPKRRGRPKGSKNKPKKLADSKNRNTIQKNIIMEQKKYLCLSCGKEKNSDNFYRSHSKIHAGNDYLLPMCKTCLEKLYHELETKYTKEIEESEHIDDENFIDKKIIKRLCMMNDIYYKDSLFESALKHSSSHTMLSAYMKIVNLLQYRRKTYENTFSEEFDT